MAFILELGFTFWLFIGDPLVRRTYLPKQDKS